MMPHKCQFSRLNLTSQGNDVDEYIAISREKSTNMRKKEEIGRFQRSLEITF